MAAILVTVAPATCPSNFDLINIQNHLCTVLSLNLVCTQPPQLGLSSFTGGATTGFFRGWMDQFNAVVFQPCRTNYGIFENYHHKILIVAIFIFLRIFCCHSTLARDCEMNTGPILTSNHTDLWPIFVKLGATFYCFKCLFVIPVLKCPIAICNFNFIIVFK